MSNNLILGIILALTGGIANNSGALLQKFAINKIPKEEREKGFYKKLFKSPSWVIGLILIMGASGVLISLAQLYIGGALIPGLMAVGMIVLTIGAVKLLGEKLKLAEYIGIFLLIIGIVLIGLSALEITDDDMANLEGTNFVIRFMIYSVAFFILWIGSRQLGKRLEKGKTIFLALGAGFPFALANAWMQPFIFIFREFINGIFTTLNIILFIFSILIVAGVNIVGIGHVQDAFKHGDASKIYPISLIPQQIAPVILFYGIYLKASPQIYSLYLLLIGIIIILIAGFLLGRKQGQIETMGLKEDTEHENGRTKELELL
ncbi:MAG TPA: DMT family transporter [candidate division Zixibacteria bacterium]|nr:DMT family transporter [candidate division Zixibacteria bacterium]